jgi:hypothetical protein
MFLEFVYFEVVEVIHSMRVWSRRFSLTRATPLFAVCGLPLDVILMKG